MQMSSPLLAQIRQRSYWRVVIHPGDFRADRIPLDALSPLLEHCAFRSRIWELPPLPANEGFARGEDWIESAARREAPRDYWRFYQSGQFLYYGSLGEDRGTEPAHVAESPRCTGQDLDVARTILRFAGVFALASNLALARDFRVGGQLHVGIDLYGLRGRRLVSEDPRGRPFREHRAEFDDFSHRLDTTAIELVATAHQQALRALERLFAQFGWHPAPGLLAEIQDEYWRR
jgi:hypothetical protein